MSGEQGWGRQPGAAVTRNFHLPPRQLGRLQNLHSGEWEGALHTKSATIAESVF